MLRYGVDDLRLVLRERLAVARAVPVRYAPLRVNLEWLRDWVELDADVARIADALDHGGSRSRRRHRAGRARARRDRGRPGARRARHPNADRLSVCIVDDGAARHQVVCGAPNVAAGIKAPFARVGARLPGGKEIRRRRAARRAVGRDAVLGQGARARRRYRGGLMLLDADAPLGMPLKDYLRLDDAIFEVNVTPNRGDCFSVLGIARELAAASRGAARAAASLGHRRRPQRTRFPSSCKAGALCPRFAGRVVRGLTTGGKSPLWMRERLRRAGSARDSSGCRRHELRDARARPAAARLRPEQARGRIVVRLAHAGESLVLLDGKTVELARRRARDRGRCETRRARRRHGRRVDRRVRREHVDPARIRVLLAASGRRPRAAFRLAHRRVACASSAASTRRSKSARSSARPSCCSRSAAAKPGRSPWPSARPTCRSARRALAPRSDCMPCSGSQVPGDQVARLLRRLEMRVEDDGADWRVTPPAFRFDIRHRGRPDRGGRPDGRLRSDPADAGRDDRASGPRDRDPASTRRPARRLARRARLQRSHHLRFVDPALEAAIDPGALSRCAGEPDRERPGGAAHARSGPACCTAARHNLSHQRSAFKLFEIGPEFAADGGRRARDRGARGLAIGSRAPEHWDGAGPKRRFLRRQGRLEALLAAHRVRRRIRFRAGDSSRVAPRASRAHRAGRAGRRLARRAAPGSAEHARSATRDDRVRAATRCDLRDDGARVPGLLEVPVDPTRPRDRRRRADFSRRRVDCDGRGRPPESCCSTSSFSTYTVAAG